MKLFVTGATGFIGSYFARLALHCGHEVVATLRQQSVVPIGLQGIRWIPAALGAIDARDFVGCDALVHFAATGVSPRKSSREEMTHWNVDVSMSLIEHAALAGVKRIVVAGTFAEYGRSANDFDRIPTNAPLFPTTHYGASKAACFVSAYGAAVELRLELCYLRVFSAFGTGQFEANFWPALRRAALSGEHFSMTPGEQVRDYVGVEVVAEKFLQAVSRRDVESGVPLVRNVGSGQAVTMAAFAQSWWQRWNATGELRIGDLPYRSNEVMRFVPLITD